MYIYGSVPKSLFLNLPLRQKGHKVTTQHYPGITWPALEGPKGPQRARRARSGPEGPAPSEARCRTREHRTRVQRARSARSGPEGPAARVKQNTD